MPKLSVRPKGIPASSYTSRVPKRWQLQEAKAKLSHLVKESRKAPQIITVHGQEVAVLHSIEDYRRQCAKDDNRPNLLEALLKCPKGPDLVIHRDKNDIGRNPPTFD